MFGREPAGDVTEVVAGRFDAWPAGPVGQRVERVDHGNVERCEVPHVPGENRKIVDTGRRRDGKVGKARRLTRGARSVHQQPGEARRANVERHHPVAVERKNDIEPVVETVGADEAAGPPLLGDALADLATVTVDRKRSSERASSQPARAAAPSRWPGAPIERTFVSTRYKAEPKVRRRVTGSYRAARYRPLQAPR